jgi:hypothetical protein
MPHTQQLFMQQQELSQQQIVSRVLLLPQVQQ